MFKRSVKNIYAVFVTIALPILAIYAIPGTQITFSSISLGITAILLFISIIKEQYVVIDWVYFPFLLYVLLHTIITFAVYTNFDAKDLMLSVGQYLLYLIFLCFFNKMYFDKLVFIKLLLIVADITSIYLLIQQLLYTVFDIMLGAGLPFLPLKNEGLRTYVDEVRRFDQTYRPRSLFPEPAMYSTFTILSLIVLVTMVNPKSKKENRIKMFRTVIYFLGIIVCKSTLGIVTIVCILAIYFVLKLKMMKKKFWQLASVFLILSPIIVFILLQNSAIQFQIQRLTDDNFMQKEARFQLFNNIELLDLTSWYKVLFGHDFIVTGFPPEIFLTSFFRQLYCFGIVGVVILAILLIRIFIRGDFAQRLLLCAFVIFMLGSEIIHGGIFLAFGVWFLDERKGKVHNSLENNNQTLKSDLDKSG